MNTLSPRYFQSIITNAPPYPTEPFQYCTEHGSSAIALMSGNAVLDTFLGPIYVEIDNVCGQSEIIHREHVSFEIRCDHGSIANVELELSDNPRVMITSHIEYLVVAHFDLIG